MRDFRYGYEPYHRLDGELPALPPVSHRELGRQEALIPARQPELTNSCVAQAPPEPVTLESLAKAFQAMVDELGPLPARPPVVDLSRIAVMLPELPPGAVGYTIYRGTR